MSEKKLICLLLAGLMIFGMMTMTACGKNGEENGVPAGSGTETEPDSNEIEQKTVFTVGEGGDFAGPAEALAYIKDTRAGGNADPMTVRIKAGEYFIEETLVIDETMPDITVEAYGDGEVRLVGGYKVTGFGADTFNGKDCISAPVRDIDFNDFYVNGERAEMTHSTVKSDEAEDQEEWNSSSVWFTVDNMLDRFTIDRALISFNHRWVDEHAKLVSFDPETKRVTMDRPSRFLVSRGMKVNIENVPEFFKRANDWYAADGRVYYIPRDDSITPETIDAYIPLVEKLIDIRGTAEKPVTGITLRGITGAVSKTDFESNFGGVFRASDPQSWVNMEGFISLHYATGCAFEDCRFTDYGHYGVSIDYGCHEITVDRCEFYDGGSGGIRMIGSENEESPEATDHNAVRDCTIHHCGRYYNAGCGILMVHTGNNVIEHNEISDLFYSGISCGWGWNELPNPSHDNTISWNHIYDIGQRTLSDLGGIYTLSPQPGTVISYNLVHDISHADYGSRAFALDEGSSYLTIENNICYNCGTGAIGSAHGMSNVARNNIFCSGNELVYGGSVYEGISSLILEHNIIVTKGVPVMELWRDDLELGPVKTSNNLYWDAKGREIIAASLIKETTLTMEELRDQYGLEEGTVVADPLFADYENHDFTLAEDSPAFDIGFVPFDLSGVGPRK